MAGTRHPAPAMLDAVQAWLAKARADGPTNSQTRGARVTICSGRPGPPQRTSDLPKLRKREMVSFTARLRGMGTGISEASKGVPIFSFATQGGKQVSFHSRQRNWVQAREAQIRFPAG